MRAEATDLIEEAGASSGVRAKTPEWRTDVRADLMVGCDGRHSTMRERAGLAGRRSRRADGRAVVSHLRAEPTDRRDVRPHRGRRCWSCSIAAIIGNARIVIPKGGIDRVRRAASRRFATAGRDCRRFCPTASASSRASDDVKLLERRGRPAAPWWRPGLLCIGDAAHAMSPIGGVGINIAVQDAVAAANRLAAPLQGAARRAARSARGAAAARFAGAHRPSDSAHDAESRSSVRPCKTRDAEAAAAVQAVRCVSAAAAHPRSPVGARVRPEHVHPHAA